MLAVGQELSLASGGYHHPLAHGPIPSSSKLVASGPLLLRLRISDLFGHSLTFLLCFSTLRVHVITVAHLENLGYSPYLKLAG